MKRFLLELCLFSLVLIGILYPIARFTDARLQNCDKGRMNGWYNISHGRVNADVLIMGNSHAHVQVDPRILDSVYPGRQFYNMGMDCFYFDMQLARYRFYRRYNKAPKAVLICADYFVFNHSEPALNRTQFLPFLYDTAIRKVVGSLSMNSISRSIGFLRYRGEANAVIAALRRQSPIPGDESVQTAWKGFMPVNKHWDEATFDSDTADGRHFGIEVDSTVWHSFLQFLTECRQQQIATYVLFTPHHERFASRVKGGAAFRSWIRASVADRGAGFIDFSNAAFCRDTALFYNGTHVNAMGAGIFTRALADSLGRNGWPGAWPLRSPDSAGIIRKPY